MNINDRTKKKEEEDPFRRLQECADGFMVVGYVAGSHEKFVQFFSKDQACRDALTFFEAPVQAWLDMGKTENEESDS